jgi:hypothetical protein
MKLALVNNDPKGFSKNYFFEVFRKEYENVYGKRFINTTQTNGRLEVLLNYFLNDNAFLESSFLNHNLSEPSLKKGLLIMGDYGTGKSSMMSILAKLNPSLFKIHHALEVTTGYEGILNHEDKKAFFNKYAKGVRLFDDLLTEEMASNYGLKNVFKEILELRYINGAKTHLICNYDPNQPKDLEEGLKQFHKKYGGRVYDRLFEMFNFIEFKGKSMRR